MTWSVVIDKISHMTPIEADMEIESMIDIAINKDNVDMFRKLMKLKDEKGLKKEYPDDITSEQKMLMRACGTYSKEQYFKVRHTVLRSMITEFRLDPNMTIDCYDRSVLLRVAGAGNSVALCILLESLSVENPIYPNNAGEMSFGFNALLSAIMGGDLNCVRLLVEQEYNGKKVYNLNVSPRLIDDSHDYDTRLPLELALWGRRLDIAQYLIDNGADPRKLDGPEFRDNSLTFVLKCCRLYPPTELIRFVKMLLDTGVNKMVVDADGYTALAIAVRTDRCYKNHAMINLLLEYGVPVGTSSEVASMKGKVNEEEKEYLLLSEYVDSVIEKGDSVIEKGDTNEEENNSRIYWPMDVHPSPEVCELLVSAGAITMDGKVPNKV